MRIIGIIPARGGSKGVPNKNRLPINGKPLIEYTIDIALQSEVCDTLVVSSDDDAILACASGSGILLHKRAATLATDQSPVTETVAAVLDYAEENKQTTFDAIILLQPTAPLRTVSHLREAIALLQQHASANAVISVTQVGDTHPARMYTVEDSLLHSLNPQFEQHSRQQLPPVYIRNGAIYIVRRSAFAATKEIMAKPALAYVMAPQYYVNIDEPRDFLLAKMLLENDNLYSLLPVIE